MEPSGQNKSYSPNNFTGSCEYTAKIRLSINVSAVAFVRFSATRLPLIYTSYIVSPNKVFFTGRSFTAFLRIVGVATGAVVNARGLFFDPLGRPRGRFCCCATVFGNAVAGVGAKIRGLFLEPLGRPRGRFVVVVFIALDRTRVLRGLNSITVISAIGCKLYFASIFEMFGINVVGTFIVMYGVLPRGRHQAYC